MRKPRTPRTPQPETPQPETPQSANSADHSTDNTPAPASPAPLNFSAGAPPHEGDVENPTPIEESAAEAPKRRRGRRKKVEVVEDIPITKDELEYVQLVMDIAIFLPCEAFFGFMSPEEKMQIKIAQLGAKVARKYLGSSISDEYKLVGLLGLWIGQQTMKKFGGANGQRTNRGIRQETAGQNPLDARILTGKN